MGPAQNGGKGKEQDRDRNKFAPEFKIAYLKDRIKCFRYQRCIVTGLRDTGLQIDHARSKDGQSRHRTNNDGIGKYLEDTPHSLLDRFAYVGIGMHHNGGTKTCLIGEYPSFAALRDDRLKCNTRCAAPCRSLCKCHTENMSECRTDMSCICDDDHQGTQDIHHYHKRDDLFCHDRDTLQSADHDESDQRHDDQADDQHIQCNIRSVGRIQHLRRKCLDIKCRSQILDDLVDLPHITDTKRCQYGTDRKENCQDTADGFHPFITAQTVLQIIHCSAGPFAGMVFATIIDAEDVF